MWTALHTPPGGVPAPLSGDVSDYVGFVEQTDAPTAQQIPTMKFGFWFQNSTGKHFLVRNRAGTVYGVELNPL